MKMFRKFTVAASALTLPASAQQQVQEGTAQGDVSVTIYQNGQSLVQDIRQLNIPRGTTRIEFPDVSAQIRPATLSFNAADTAIVEQNFDFDLCAGQALNVAALFIDAGV